MSDAAEVTPQVPTPPAETPPAPVSEPTPEPAKPTGPLSKRDARSGVRDDAQKRVGEAKAEPPKTEPPKAEPPKVAEAPTSEAEPAGEPEKPAEPVKAARTVAIPEGHPVREMGIEAFPVENEQQERALKALVNGTYHRRQEVETHKARITEQDDTIAKLQDQLARIEAGKVAEEKWRQTPEYRAYEAEYQKIREAEERGDFDPGASERYWRGIQQDLVALQDTEYRTRMDGHARTRAERRVAEWTADTRVRVQESTPEGIRSLPEFDQLFDDTIIDFNAALKNGTVRNVTRGDPESTYRAFREFLNSRLIREPAVQKAFQDIKRREQDASTAAQTAEEAKKQEREAIKQELLEELKKEGVIGRRPVAPPHPMGKFSGTDRPHVPTAPSPGQEPPAGSTVQDIRRAARAGAREDARRHVGT